MEKKKNFFRNFFEWLGKANSDGQNNPSNMRFITSYSVIILVPSIAIGWLWICYKLEVGAIISVAGLIVGLIAGLAGIKAKQHQDEQ